MALDIANNTLGVSLTNTHLSAKDSSGNKGRQLAQAQREGQFDLTRCLNQACRPFNNQFSYFLAEIQTRQIILPYNSRPARPHKIIKSHKILEKSHKIS